MGYLQLSDLGMIGNQNSAAIVSRLGSIDWCCFPYLDSPSHFSSLLDENHGGRFQIMPAGEFRSEQRYLQRTLVLETLFETPMGRGVLTDWMPSTGEPIIHRKVEVLAGRIQWAMICNPRFDYGSRPAQTEHHRGGVLFRGQAAEELAQLQIEGRPCPDLFFTGNRSTVEAKFTLEIGENVRFGWIWGRQQAPFLAMPSSRETLDFWRNLAHRCPKEGCVFAGPWHDTVSRSGLVLKLLSNSYSGSIAESITTSLPGTAGGSRTWDYRFAWIRDAALAVQALSQLGYREEAQNYFRWLSDLVIRDGPEELQPVYTLDGGKFLPERELAFLSGYQSSRPVRVGNNSSRQFELDIYGHILLAAHEYHSAFGEIPMDLWPRLAEVADYICQVWRRPDHGPWEIRSRAEHFVSSKAMCWAGLDRAIRLAELLGSEVPHRWREERDILHHTICTHGYDEKLASFVRSFGSNEIDAANLQLPLLGFLPFDDPRIISTLHKIESQLSDGVLLRRYAADDGMPGADGAYLPSSFLLVSCLALAGRVDEAADRLAELCTFATSLGLFGEQVDLTTRDTTGNFPSASTHLALINASLYVGMARGRHGLLKTALGSPAPRGGEMEAQAKNHRGSMKIAFKNPLKLGYRW